MESNIRCRSYPHEYPKSAKRYFTQFILSTSQSVAEQSLDPNTSSPANLEASNLYKDNRKEYTKRVREVVEKSWED